MGGEAGDIGFTICHHGRGSSAKNATDCHMLLPF
jgi:hypothetical protein